MVYRYADMAELADAHGSGSDWHFRLTIPRTIVNTGVVAPTRDWISPKKTFSSATFARNVQRQFNMRMWRNWHTRMVQVLVGVSGLPNPQMPESNGLLAVTRIIFSSKKTFSSATFARYLQKKLNMRMWRNWHTRTVQVRVKAISCRFKSCYPHQLHIIRTMSSLWETGSDL